MLYKYLYSLHRHIIVLERAILPISDSLLPIEDLVPRKTHKLQNNSITDIMYGLKSLLNVYILTLLYFIVETSTDQQSLMNLSDIQGEAEVKN